MAKNYYFILDVDSDATPEQIKSAYYRRVMDFHPDHYGENCEPFLAIQEAHAVLGDPIRRWAYDLLLHKRPFPPTPREAVAEMIMESRPPRVELLAPKEEIYDLGSLSLTQSFQTFFPSFDEIFDRLRFGIHNFFLTAIFKVSGMMGYALADKS